jgi:adenine-specific DNA-methyltransferase
MGKYEHLSKQELLAMLQKRDAERRLGLVWERDELEHETALNDDFVTLELDSKLSSGQPPYNNFLVEGDNFDVLRYLHIAYKGRVKCIYIDPPYNTGNKDFIYNDIFVAKDDAYRHSKWLEYMHRRLLLAKDLLSEDGAIFISIDDIEAAHLSLLLDQIFPEMRVGTFVWRRRSGANDSKDWFLSVDHEYVLCYANKGFSFAGSTKNMSSYSNPDGDVRGDWNNDNLVKAHNFKQRPDAYYPIHDPKTDIWYPCDPDNVWRFASKARLGAGKKIRTKVIEQLIEEKRVLWPQDDTVVEYKTLAELQHAIEERKAPRNLQVYLTLDTLKQQVENNQAPAKLLGYIEQLEAWVGRKIGFGKPRYKRFAKELKRTEKPVSTYVLPSSMKKNDLEALNLEEVTSFTVGFTSEGTSLLSQMLGNKDFQYPKPMSLIKSLVAQATDADSNHIVLDFFAGSGTTAHAVLALNEEDGGNRSFMLVSSTEATAKEPVKNVCRDITSKRLQAAIQGYSFRQKQKLVKVEGLGGEYAYLKANRVPRQTLAIDIRHEQVWMALQQLHASVVSPYVENVSFQELSGENLKYDMLYVPSLDDSKILQLIDRLSEQTKPCVVFSWQSGLLLQRVKNSNVKIEKIPDYLIERFGRVDQ